MKALVEKIIETYPQYLRNEATFEQHLSARENPDMRDALGNLRIKLGVVESWFALLDTDERFALRQMLDASFVQDGAQLAAAAMWTWQLFQEGKTPWQMREQALNKISSFAIAHRKTMRAIFHELL